MNRKLDYCHFFSIEFDIFFSIHQYEFGTEISNDNFWSNVPTIRVHHHHVQYVALAKCISGNDSFGRVSEYPAQPKVQIPLNLGK